MTILFNKKTMNGWNWRLKVAVKYMVEDKKQKYRSKPNRFPRLVSYNRFVELGKDVLIS